MMQAVFEALARHADERPDCVSFEDDHNAISWSALANRVACLVAGLNGAPDTVAIALAGGIDYVVADLAVTLTGRRQVPLPFFFSREQTAHILAETGVTAVISNEPKFSQEGRLRVISPDTARVSLPLPSYGGGASRVIYTSGSSGRPKGVIIGDRQLDASLAALSDVLAAGEQDRHLSVLPLAQLLEQICGIYLPILSGAHCSMRFEVTQAVFGGSAKPLADAMEDLRPTTSLLTPGLLCRWVEELRSRATTAPEPLRFVAVGGAASSPNLIRAAENRGIPVHEGYGLSECCSVVAINRPGENRAGCVGPVLDGLDVTIEDGEIVVAGPTVMEGYLGAPAVPPRWRTGDLGHFENGSLVIEGRKDALIVTSAGRNISPEWIETTVSDHPDVICAAVAVRQIDGALILVIVASKPIGTELIASRLTNLPDYARPSGVIFFAPAPAGLLFPAGTPNRKVAATIANSEAAEPLQYDHTPRRLAS